MARAAYYLAIGAAVGVGLGGVSLATTATTAKQGLALYKYIYETALERDFFVDKPDPTKMTEAAINGMLASLDPHSNYFDPKQLDDFQSSMRGENFGGLGLEVMQEGALVKVVSPIDDTPAARAGLLANDVIVKIDDTDVDGLTLKEAVDRMRGPANTTVRLTVTREPGHAVKQFTIVRDIIHVQPVRSHIEGGDIGYIRITQFNEETYDSLKAALAKFKASPGEANLKGFILDLTQDVAATATERLAALLRPPSRPPDRLAPASDRSSRPKTR